MPNPNRQARYPRDLVKLLNENIDLDALVFDTDASGNPIVVDSKSGDTIAFYDRDTGEWNLSDINVQSLDADSVNTEQQFTASRVSDTVVHKTTTGDWVADHEDGQVTTGTDVNDVTQAAIDDLHNNHGGGTVAVKTNPNNLDLSEHPDTLVMIEGNNSGQFWMYGEGHSGLSFWQSGEPDDYMGLYWYPERRWSGDNVAGDKTRDWDVGLTAHKTNGDGSSDQHLSIYTTDAADEPTKRLDVAYQEDRPRVIWQNLGEHITRSDAHGWRNGDNERVIANYAASGIGFVDINPRERTTDAGAYLRLFRNTSTAGARLIEVFKGDGTGTTTFAIDAAAGDIKTIDAIRDSVQMAQTGEVVNLEPQDVRNITGSRGDIAYHDGSGSNQEGPAHHNGTDWLSTVDGSLIS